MGQDKGYPKLNFHSATQETSHNGAIVNKHVNVQSDHKKIIREIGAASAVLLKNTKNALPLDVKKLRRYALIGSDAGPNVDGANGCPE